jgi:threonine/homoserine/homoserine lactone efflux protein
VDGIINLPLFVISSVIIIIAPGPDFIYVTTRGVYEGHKAGVISAFGISIGLVIHTLFAAFGLSAIIQASSIAYLVLKFLGAGYLVYLGVKTLISKSKPGSNIAPLNNRRSIFQQAILTNVFNPKAIITFMAFLPQFVNMRIHNPIGQFIFLGTILSVIAVLWFGIVGYFAGMIGGLIKRNRIFQNVIKNISGTIMIALGLRLALKKD